MPPETRRPNRAAEQLIGVIENPSKKLEKNIDRIERQMGAFQASAEADIAKLLKFDHQDIRSAVTDAAYKESLRNIQENYDVLKSLIAMLRSAPQSERSTTTIASLETLLQSVEDSLVGHDYRKRNALPSAEKQVEQYIASISQLKGDETIPDTDAERFSHQPDIVEMYHLGFQEHEAAQRIIDADYSVADILQYVEQVVEHSDPATWTEANCESMLAVIKVMEKLQELSLFKTQIEAQLHQLKELLGKRMAQASSAELVVPIGVKAKEMPESVHAGIEATGTLLTEILFSESSLEDNGWIEADKATADKLLQLAQSTRKQLGIARLLTYRNVLSRTAGNERAALDKQIEFCRLVEEFALKLKNQPDQLKLLKPLAKELKLKAPYVLLDEQAQAQKQADETEKAAA